VAHQGEVLKNPVTGQSLVFRRTTAETAGDLLEVESSWAPGGDEPVAHYHPRQEERFEVLAGKLGVRVGDERRELEAGDTLVLPAGTVHAMWNAGQEEARAVWQTRPALKTEAFFETAWGLARDGQVNERGMPGLLQSAVLMNEYADEFRLAKPPYGVQRALFGVLAPLGRALGRPARYPATR
jgi:quercetin dioxygenase-like cupin family protein